MKVLLAIALVASCSAPPAPTPPGPPQVPIAPVNTELSPALAPLAWWLGDWRGNNTSEHWIAVGGVLYGIALPANGRWEVMIVDDGDGDGPADGVLRFIAMPGGTRAVEFTKETLAAQSIVFANPAHDDPKKIGYARTETGLRASLYGDANRVMTFDFAPFTRTQAPEIEAADRAFSDDARKRGIDGWLAAFAPNGAMMRAGRRIERTAIAEIMTPILTSGTLSWEPVASGTRDKLGFTVGKGTFRGKSADARMTTYVTIWQLQPDGTWKVLFDVGRPVNAPTP